MYAHLNDRRRTSPRTAPGLPPTLDAVITIAMAKKPSDRYPSAGDRAAARVIGTDSTPARTRSGRPDPNSSFGGRRRHGTWLGGHAVRHKGRRSAGSPLAGVATATPTGAAPHFTHPTNGTTRHRHPRRTGRPPPTAAGAERGARDRARLLRRAVRRWRELAGGRRAHAARGVRRGGPARLRRCAVRRGHERAGPRRPVAYRGACLRGRADSPRRPRRPRPRTVDGSRILLGVGIPVGILVAGLAAAGVFSAAISGGGKP